MKSQAEVSGSSKKRCRRISDDKPVSEMTRKQLKRMILDADEPSWRYSAERRREARHLWRDRYYSEMR